LKLKHRLTKPGTPKTNGMIERVNNTVKTATLKNTLYKLYEKLEKDLIYYNSKRCNSGLLRELKVRTPLNNLVKIENKLYILVFKIK